jgi:hypothetical protein
MFKRVTIATARILQCGRGSPLEITLRASTADRPHVIEHLSARSRDIERASPDVPLNVLSCEHFLAGRHGGSPFGPTDQHTPTAISASATTLTRRFERRTTIRARTTTEVRVTSTTQTRAGCRRSPGCRTPLAHQRRPVARIPESSARVTAAARSVPPEVSLSGAPVGDRGQTEQRNSHAFALMSGRRSRHGPPS